jgi:hypothetical protein
MVPVVPLVPVPPVPDVALRLRFTDAVVCSMPPENYCGDREVRVVTILPVVNSAETMPCGDRGIC